MVYAMRRPSGESSALPTDRKREMSLLAKPCAAPQGAEARSATVERNPETTRRKTKRNCACMKSTPPNFGKMWFLLRSERTRNCLFQILIHPLDPVAVNVHLANRVAGKMSGNGDGDELHRHAVVFQRVEEGVGLRDGHAGISSVVHDERRSFHLRSIGDGRLRAIVLEVVADVGRALEAVAGSYVKVREIVFVVEVGHRRTGHGRLPDLVVADEPGGHIAAVGPAGHPDFIFVDETQLLERIDAGYDVATRTVASIVPDSALVGVAEIVAAAIVR